MFSVVLFLASTSALLADDPWPCDRKEAIAAFEKKSATVHYVFNANPYKNQTAESTKKINEYLKDETSVCAIRYFDARKKEFYETKHFPNEAAALDQKFIVTHQGRCGACSTLQDLAVYLKMNLTTAVRKCGAWTISPLVRRCLYKLGFSSTCVDIWEYNIFNTRSKCLWVCMKAWMTGEPFNKPDGNLNDCLQCDEDKSGPVFKYFSGRTRRNSGVTSAIHRPGSQVYKMNHCYY